MLSSLGAKGSLWVVNEENIHEHWWIEQIRSKTAEIDDLQWHCIFISDSLAFFEWVQLCFDIVSIRGLQALWANLLPFNDLE